MMAYTIESRGMWTDERKAFVSDLWQDGKSATEIARQCATTLNIKVSRNSVIGIIHRMGAQGRERAAPAAKSRANGSSIRRTRSAAIYNGDPKTSPLAKKLAVSTANAAARLTRPAALVEGPGLATVISLEAHMCKWPIGDPASEDFSFCGRKRADGSYCVEHARVAYQPAQTKKRSGANELARSLRRYV